MGRFAAGWRRRILSVAPAAVVVVFVVAVLMAASPARAPTRVLSVPPASVPVVAGLEMPKTIVSLSETGTVVLLDTTTGNPLRVLARHEPGSLQGVAIAPDRRSAYYAVSSGCGVGTIYRVDLDGAAVPRRVATGVSPAVSPDGRQLAYAAPGSPLPEGGTNCHNVVVVQDLQTHTFRSWRYPDDENHRWVLYQGGSFTKIAWSPDSTRLALTLSYEGDSVSVLDIATDGDLSETEEVVIPGGGGDSRHPAWQGSSGLLAIVNSAFECCFEDNYQGPTRTLLVDVPNRRSEDLLAPGVQPTWLDFDWSGDHLLYVDAGHLYRRTQQEAPILVAKATNAADW